MKIPTIQSSFNVSKVEQELDRILPNLSETLQRYGIFDLDVRLRFKVKTTRERQTSIPIASEDSLEAPCLVETRAFDCLWNSDTGGQCDPVPKIVAQVVIKRKLTLSSRLNSEPDDLPRLASTK